MKIVVRFVFVIICLATLVAQPSPAFACSCVTPNPPPQATFDKTDAVFAGEVTQINNPHASDTIITTTDPLYVVIEVSDSWKGVTTSPVVIETAQVSASCGYNFTVGTTYVVYAYDNNSALETNLCTRTAEKVTAVDDLAYLNSLPQLAVTAEPLALPTPETTVPIINYVVIAVVILAVVGGAVGAASFLAKKAAD